MFPCAHALVVDVHRHRDSPLHLGAMQCNAMQCTGVMVVMVVMVVMAVMVVMVVMVVIVHGHREGALHLGLM